MTQYAVSAAVGGKIEVLVRTDSAAEAVRRFLDALERYPRAWVSDPEGNDLTFDELIEQASRSQ